MNKVILMGRLTRDAEIKAGANTTIARFNLAVDRRFAKDDDAQKADFIGCVAFGKTAEFLERFGRKGMKFVIEGRIQTGSYTNKDGQKVYTTDVITESVEFAESKAASQASSSANSEPMFVPAPDNDSDFMNIPDGIEDELPF